MAGIETPTLASEVIGHLGGFELRNTMIMAWLAILVLTLVSVTGKLSGYRMVPGRFQAVLELVVEGLFNFFNAVLGDEKKTRLVFPLIATIFLYIVVANWMGILPGVGSITILGMHDGHEMAIPILRSMNADVNMTLGLALLAIICVQFFGMLELGMFSYLGKFFVAPWKDFAGMFVGLLEFVGEFSRMISFSFRLFGNIFAGEVLLVVVSFLVPYVAPIPFLGLELFVGVIQGLVFAMLTTVFLSMAMTAHDHGDDHAVSKRDLSARVLQEG